MFVTAIVPAAGQSSRMQADKLSLVYKDRTIFARALEPLLCAAGVDEVIVVVAPDSRLPVEGARCRAVVNADRAEGMGASLRAGVAAAPQQTEAYLIALADMPEITTALVEQLVDAFCRSHREILVPCWRDEHGHPVIFGNQYRDELLQLRGDTGARSIVRRHAHAVERFATDDPAVVFDIDTPQHLALRRIEFPNTAALGRAAARLRAAGLWHSTEHGRDQNAAIRLAYYNYDEARIRALCPEGIVAE